MRYNSPAPEIFLYLGQPIAGYSKDNSEFILTNSTYGNTRISSEGEIASKSKIEDIIMKELDEYENEIKGELLKLYDKSVPLVDLNANQTIALQNHRDTKALNEVYSIDVQKIAVEYLGIQQ